MALEPRADSSTENSVRPSPSDTVIGFTSEQDPNAFETPISGLRAQTATDFICERVPFRVAVLSMRLLVIEDEPKVADALASGLEEEGFRVRVARDGLDGGHRALTEPWDLVVLDLYLPGMDGLEVLRRMRASGNRTRVLILTAQDSVADRVRGLEAGADDYLAKPFAFEELLARVRALLRRGREVEPEVLRLADLELDPRRRRVTRGGREVELTAREFEVLAFLLRHAGEVVSRTRLVEHVWDENFDSLSNVVDVTLYHVRTKVDRGFPEPLIHTVRGAGYVIREPDHGR